MSDRRRSSFRDTFAKFNATHSEDAFEDVIDHPDCSLSANISRCSAIVDQFEGQGAPVRYIEAVMFKLGALEIAQEVHP
jgi:hypothetical protein